jgi:leader peptidase (prepilin peptidase) / N-methyltransferase
MAPAVVLAFVGGLMAGSFTTVVSHRVPRGESIVGPRSRCPGCGSQIAAYDNIPVFSWVLLGGRSRCCGERISARYPLTELALAALYALTVIVLWDDLTEVLLGLVFVTTLVAITVTDLERRIIPNKILLVAAILGVAIVAVGDPGSLPERALAALAAGGGLFLVVLAYPRGMGLGDVKLAALMGLFLGRNVGPAIIVALLAGSVAGARKRAIPFGPFLALGGLVGLLAGDEIVDWYLSTFS